MQNFLAGLGSQRVMDMYAPGLGENRWLVTDEPVEFEK
jgi:hypothetical protein